MNLDKIKGLIQDNSIKEAVMKILELEQSQLHKMNYRYKEQYYSIIKEVLNDENN